MTPVLHAEGLRKTYQSFVALEGLDLSIPEGSIYGLLGPNGAGKTTFLRMVNQIIAPDSGHLRFQGQDMTPA
ncbi:MAG: ATP-binding cassette domain-containing protein, partial [Flavobacteriia bacterium]|nr:ATP-binding cassette domain-containing protein [Flavobacteriia bacterium]